MVYINNMMVLSKKHFSDEYIKRKLEYHEGYYAVGNNIPYDKNQTDSWKEGYKDGYYSIYDEDFKEK